MSALLIILVSLTRSLFSEKMLISNRCISGLIPNLIKKSWTVSIVYVHAHAFVYFGSPNYQTVLNKHAMIDKPRTLITFCYLKIKHLIIEGVL